MVSYAYLKSTGCLQFFKEKLLFEKEKKLANHITKTCKVMFARNHLESIKICAAEMIKPFLQNLQRRAN